MGGLSFEAFEVRPKHALHFFYSSRFRILFRVFCFSETPSPSSNIVWLSYDVDIYHRDRWMFESWVACCTHFKVKSNIHASDQLYFLFHLSMFIGRAFSKLGCGVKRTRPQGSEGGWWSRHGGVTGDIRLLRSFLITVFFPKTYYQTIK